MNLKFVEVIKIYSNNNDLLLEYPKNTLLDEIIDVWPIIIRYLNPNLFMIGKHCDNYNGFRLITRDECKTKLFISLFYANYIERNGIAVLFDNNYVGDGIRYISSNNSLILIGLEAIRIQRKIFKKNDIVGCETNYYPPNDIANRIHNISIGGIWSECKLGMGLFMPTDFFFSDQ